MLEVNLYLVLPVGKRLPTPTRDRLKIEYFHAANIETVADKATNIDEYINRVITLRPNAKPKYTTYRVKNPIHRGYFAYGKKEGESIVFDIYAPHPSVKSKFPPKALEIALGLFILRLIKEGYKLNPYSVKFSTYINGEEK